MTTARELLQEALTYSNAWLTALEADGEDEAAASQAEFNERITAFLAQPEPEPSAEVERIMELADQYYRSAYHDESSIERESLRAEVERLVRERDEAVEIVSTLRLIEQEIDEYKLRAEAAEAEVMRLRKGGCARDQGLTQYCAEAANAIGIAQACEKLAKAAERDAERYQWLVQDTRNMHKFLPLYWDGCGSPQGLDDAIDAAIKESK